MIIIEPHGCGEETKHKPHLFIPDWAPVDEGEEFDAEVLCGGNPTKIFDFEHEAMIRRGTYLYGTEG